MKLVQEYFYKKVAWKKDHTAADITHVVLEVFYRGFVWYRVHTFERLWRALLWYGEIHMVSCYSPQSAIYQFNLDKISLASTAVQDQPWRVEGLEIERYAIAFSSNFSGRIIRNVFASTKANKFHRGRAILLKQHENSHHCQRSHATLTLLHHSVTMKWNRHCDLIGRISLASEQQYLSVNHAQTVSAAQHKRHSSEALWLAAGYHTHSSLANRDATSTLNYRSAQNFENLRSQGAKGSRIYIRAGEMTTKGLHFRLLVTTKMSHVSTMGDPGNKYFIAWHPQPTPSME